MSAGIPFSEEVEQGALGAMMLDPATNVPVAVSKLRMPAEAFYVPAHAMVAGAIFELATGGLHKVDMLTVFDKLRVAGDIERVGGMGALEKMADAAVTATNGPTYLEAVWNKWILRQVLDIAHEAGSQCHTTERASDVLQYVSGALSKIQAGVGQDVDRAALMEVAIAGWATARERRIAGEPLNTIGIRTPWDPITELTCGLEPGTIVLGGRPSAGKTTMEDILALCAAEAGAPAGRVTLDASAKELLQRALCRRCGMSLPRLKFGFAGDRHLAAARDEAKRLANLPFYFLENCYEISQIMAWARMMKSRKGIGLLTVDYLQQVMCSELGRENMNPVVRVSYAIGQLKRLALELDIPVLVLSQLSREVEKDKREPQLSDLRDSGAIEQDAHKVWFLYRDVKKVTEMEDRNPGATKHKRPVWFNQMKLKDGELGAYELWLYPPYFRFEVAREGFSDDALPADESKTHKDLEARPAYMPRDEGVKHPAPAAHSTSSGQAVEPEEFWPAGPDGND